MDPTHKNCPFSTSTTNHPHPHPHPHPQPHPHPPPDPTTISTIQHISHRFSKLYTNHHNTLVQNSSRKPPTSTTTSNHHSHPQPETDLIKPKTLSFFPVSNSSSCPTFTKSKSHHERNFTTKEKDEIKIPSIKKDPKKQSFQEFDVKKASQLMSKSLDDCDKVKRFQQVSSSIPPKVVNGNGGRRMSFGSSQVVDLADFFSCTGVKVVAVDMPPLMQIHAVNCARKTHDSLEKFTSKTLALTLKKEFDGIYGPAWHCIVGTSFGSFVTHSVGGFMYFSMDHKIYVLLFKTTVQRAE